MKQLLRAMTATRWHLVALLLASQAALFGAWGGQLDGNQHPTVGAVYADFNRDGQIQWFEMIVSTTSGGDANCRATNYNYRLDTAGAREFLGQFLPLP